MKTCNSGGFVLLEVMLAVVVLTGGIVVISQSCRSSLRAIVASRELFRAGLLMESQIAELEKTGETSKALTTDALLDPVSWDDEVRSSDLLYGEEHHLTLHWGNDPQANILEQTLYVAK